MTLPAAIAVAMNPLPNFKFQILNLKFKIV